MFTHKNLMHLLYYGHTQYCLPRLSRPQLMLPFVGWNFATVEPRQSHSCYGCGNLPATIQLPLMETLTQESWLANGNLELVPLAQTSSHPMKRLEMRIKATAICSRDLQQCILTHTPASAQPGYPTWMLGASKNDAI